MVKKYRKLPVVIEAIQFDGGHQNVIEIVKWSDNDICRGGLSPCRNSGSSVFELVIPTLEGDMIANHGDYIIKGVNGEFYPCKSDIFEKTYEECGYGKGIYWKDKVGLKVFKLDLSTLKVSEADTIYRDNEDGSMNENGFRWIGVTFNDGNFDYEPALNLEDAIEIFKSKIGK